MSPTRKEKMATIPCSPLTVLPIEIQRIIATHLDFPDNMNLRMSNKLLYASIDSLTFPDAVQAETTPFARARHLFACKDCCRLRPSRKFRDNRDDYLRDWNVNNRYRESRESNDTKPYCIDCGFKNCRPGFALGKTFDIDVTCSEAQVFCDCCDEFLEPSQRKIESYCRTCWAWVLEHPNEVLKAETVRYPKRRQRWAEIQTGSAGIYHSIRCENEACRAPFMDCRYVASNTDLVARSGRQLQYCGYS